MSGKKKYDWELVQKLHNEGMSCKELFFKFGVSASAFTDAKLSGYFQYNEDRRKKYNWQEIQKDYDSGLTWRDLTEKHGVAQSAITRARNRGDFVSRNHSESQLISKYKGHKHTQETKDKISRIRIKYLEEHPDKVPYLINHSSKRSYPELLFENALLKSRVHGWKSKYRIGIYEYDFAFLKKKIDVEVDGGTHLSDKVIKIDTRRDIWSKSNGWKVVRFTAKEVKFDIDSCIERLKMEL